VHVALQHEKPFATFAKSQKSKHWCVLKKRCSNCTAAWVPYQYSKKHICSADCLRAPVGRTGPSNLLSTLSFKRSVRPQVHLP